MAEGLRGKVEGSVDDACPSSVWINIYILPRHSSVVLLYYS